MLIEWFWSRLCSFKAAELGLEPSEKTPLQGLGWLLQTWGATAGFEQGANRSEVMVYENDSGFEVHSKEPPPKKALQWWRSCEHTVPGLCCQAGWLGLLRCHGALVVALYGYRLCLSALASFFSSLLPLLLLRVSSLLF